MIVCTPEDKFEVKLGEICLVFSPMTKRQKLDVVKSGKIENGEETNNLDMVIRSLQYCLKEVSGITLKNGKPFELEIVDGKVSEKCIDVLLNTSMSDSLALAAMEFIVGVPDTLKNVLDGDEVKDVKVKYLDEVEDSKKKNP